MTEDEQRAILEQIARNEDNYPRDRIAAVRALREMGDGLETIDDVFDRLTARTD
jgi:plasmid stability protein